MVCPALVSLSAKGTSSLPRSAGRSSMRPPNVAANGSAHTPSTAFATKPRPQVNSTGTSLLLGALTYKSNAWQTGVSAKKHKMMRTPRMRVTLRRVTTSGTITSQATSAPPNQNPRLRIKSTALRTTMWGLVRLTQGKKCASETQQTNCRQCAAPASEVKPWQGAILGWGAFPFERVRLLYLVRRGQLF